MSTNTRLNNYNEFFFKRKPFTATLRPFDLTEKKGRLPPKFGITDLFEKNLVLGVPNSTKKDQQT
jgi:hypothetical protein